MNRGEALALANAALVEHYHGGMYGVWGAFGHDPIASSCNACWISAQLAVDSLIAQPAEARSG